MDWMTFLSAFGLLFVAELGDKTQLAVLSQVCKYRRPWFVFLGGSLALAGITALGVLFGRLLGDIIPALLMRRLAAAAFFIMGLLILIEWVSSRNNRPACPADETDSEKGGKGHSSWLAFSTTFGLLAVAELGDKTQLAALSMASQTSSALSVFFGATLALCLITGLAVVLGEGLCRLIPERMLKLMAGCAFIAMGILIGFGLM